MPKEPDKGLSSVHEGSHKKLPPWETCGFLLVDHLRVHPSAIFLFDVDGVILQGDSLYEPTVTTMNVVPVLKDLENLGVSLGIATARGKGVLDFLRGLGLRFEGPSILEEGHISIFDQKEHFLSKPTHPQFIIRVQEVMKQHPFYKQEWEMVRLSEELSMEPLFCPGNYQWQGNHRISFWFSYKDGASSRGQEILHIFEPQLRQAAQVNRLSYEDDVDVKVSRTHGGLGVLRIAAKKTGEKINKGMAAKYYMAHYNGWIFVGDGFGDLSLAQQTKLQGGKVVGIEGNLDDVAEIKEFLASSDSVLQSPKELVETLQFTVNLLSRNHG